MVITCESVLAAVALTLAVLALTGTIAVWQRYAFGLVQGLALALDAPARHTLVFRIVGRGDLANAVALSSGLGTTARLVGPAVGGLVVAAAGPGVAFAGNAVSYVVAICAVIAMRIAPAPTSRGAATPVVAGVVETFRFAFGQTRVAVTFLCVLLVSMFAFNFDVLLPLVARLTLHEGAEVFGLIASVFGAGALCGALDPGDGGPCGLALVLGGAAGFGGFQLLLAPQSSLAAVSLVLFVIGVFYVLWGSSALAVLQLAAPEHLRGRAASLYFFGFQGGAPLGGLWAGWLVSVGGTELAFSSRGRSRSSSSRAVRLCSPACRGARCGRGRSPSGDDAGDQPCGALDLVVADQPVCDDRSVLGSTTSRARPPRRAARPGSPPPLPSR